ncbi:MAG: aldehyde dehydrogenase family protein [Thermoanaerobaculia bacterium]
MLTIEPRFERAAVVAAIARIHAAQQASRAAVGATSAAERIEKIRGLRDAMFVHRQEIREALWNDYQKPPAEVDLSEIYPVVGEANHAIRYLRRWARPQRVRTPLALFGSRSRILHEPKGVVLIISPWNFPWNLSLGPLVSAIAAGNCAILKPSELTPHTSACLKRVLAGLFDESEVAVIEGDAAVAQELLSLRFDHIFFTGSPAVGTIVMKAAAEHLTSVTLELGGKSPVIVDRSANLDEAARKIAWGKFLNCGQICIAPDYLLVDEEVRDVFLEKLRAAIAPQTGVMVSERHAQRMRALIDDAVKRGAGVVLGGGSNGRIVEPTILQNPDLQSAVMQEEIFGPILPVISYRTLDDALAVIAAREKPLVLYLFARNRRVIRDVIRNTSAGGTVINDTLVHFFQTYLPFGGVGRSGMGRAHGFFGYESFSNIRAVLDQPTRFSALQWMYPPYGRFKRKLIDWTLRWF